MHKNLAHIGILSADLYEFCHYGHYTDQYMRLPAHGTYRDNWLTSTNPGLKNQRNYSARIFFFKIIITGLKIFKRL